MTPNSIYSTNSSLAEIATRLRSCARVLVLTHLKPDGDAVGSSMGLVRTLNLLEGWSSRQRARAVYFGPTPPWLEGLCGPAADRASAYDILSSERSLESVLHEFGEPDVIVLVDTGSVKQVQPVAPYLASRAAKIVIVDHHAQGDATLGDTRVVDVASAAACLPVGELCRLMLQLPSLAALPVAVATPLYLGTATDTGWFRHSNVNAAVMTAAAGLLGAGADHVALYHMTEQNSLGRVVLIGLSLSSLELHCQDRLAVMSLTRKEIDASGAAPGDTGGITDYTQSISTVRVSVMLTEAAHAEFGLPDDASPLTKISLRSKAVEPLVDVNAIAATLGGGGHIRAAGARYAGTLEATKAKIIALVTAALRDD